MRFFVIGSLVLGVLVALGVWIRRRRSSDPDVSHSWRNEHAYDKGGDRR